MLPPPDDATRAWRWAHRTLSVIRPLLCRLTIEGRSLVPAEGGLVFACNHPGGVDVLFLGYASPRQIYYMAKRELFAVHPLFSRLIGALGAFPVQRGARDLAAIDHSISLVRSGCCLGMFPEGTRNRGAGMRVAKSGAVRIAAAAGAKIVPCAVIGVPEFHRTWADPTVRTEVTVRFGEPLQLDADVGDADASGQATTVVMQAVARLLPAELRGYYG